MKSTTFISVIGLLVTIGLTAYLDSPYSLLHKSYSYHADQPVIAQPASIEPSQQEPELIEKLTKTEKDGNYIIETYQEYEVHKDQEGNVLEEIPTSKTETLRYWDQSSVSPGVEE
ncbi:hypothetical protein [Bacillus rubiinfantis]|uniref:hypothetical protein n=1 Tax=Bacillus rubiinfantis TaxID=1499680 RepID=UPI0005A9AC2B|nr:hypothetical protein [Bacillus rubiinfantis]